MHYKRFKLVDMSQKTMEILRQCSPVFSVLQDENRQQIIILLFESGELSVASLAGKMPLSRPAVSHHLKLLLDAGLVVIRKEGKERYYRLELTAAVELLEELLRSLKNDLQE